MNMGRLGSSSPADPVNLAIMGGIPPACPSPWGDFHPFLTRSVFPCLAPAPVVNGLFQK